MITDEQARAAAERIAVIDSLDYPESVRNVLHWACQELSRRTSPDNVPMTAEEADRAYDESEAVPIPDEEIESLLQRVRDRSDKDKITAEWCLQHGAWHRQSVDDYCWDSNGAQVCAEIDPDEVVVRIGTVVWQGFTCAQLLALLAALRGEPSENPGQFEPLSPAEQLRGQQNNI